MENLFSNKDNVENPNTIICYEILISRCGCVFNLLSLS